MNNISRTYNPQLNTSLGSQSYRYEKITKKDSTYKKSLIKQEIQLLRNKLDQLTTELDNLGEEEIGQQQQYSNFKEQNNNLYASQQFQNFKQSQTSFHIQTEPSQLIPQQKLENPIVAQQKFQNPIIAEQKVENSIIAQQKLENPIITSQQPIIQLSRVEAIPNNSPSQIKPSKLLTQNNYEKNSYYYQPQISSIQPQKQIIVPIKNAIENEEMASCYYDNQMNQKQQSSPSYYKNDTSGYFRPSGQITPQRQIYAPNHTEGMTNEFINEQKRLESQIRINSQIREIDNLRKSTDFQLQEKQFYGSVKKKKLGILKSNENQLEKIVRRVKNKVNQDLKNSSKATTGKKITLRSKSPISDKKKCNDRNFMLSRGISSQFGSNHITQRGKKKKYFK